MPFAAIAALNVCLYWQTLYFDLVIDDIDWYAKWSKEHPPWYLLLYGAYPPLGVKLDHLVTLSLHVLTCLLIAAVFNPCASLLYSCHPCNNQTSIWLTGRRYSVINITVLLILLTHSYLLFIPLVLIITRFAYNQLLTRHKMSVPQGVFTCRSFLKCLYLSLSKLLGVQRFSFRYPYCNTASYLPCTQPIAERYLSLPLIFVCVLFSYSAWSVVFIPFYVFRTFELMPMYENIQSFYDYHKRLYPSLDKLALIKCLYPQIR